MSPGTATGRRAPSPPARSSASARASAASARAVSSAASTDAASGSSSSSSSPSSIVVAPGSSASSASFLSAPKASRQSRSRSQASASAAARAAICPRKSRESSRTRISGDLTPRLLRSSWHRLRSARPDDGHSGMFSVARRSETRFCIRALTSISCALADAHPVKSSRQKYDAHRNAGSNPRDTLRSRARHLSSAASPSATTIAVRRLSGSFASASSSSSSSRASKLTHAWRHRMSIAVVACVAAPASSRGSMYRRTPRPVVGSFRSVTNIASRTIDRCSGYRLNAAATSSTASVWIRSAPSTASEETPSVVSCNRVASGRRTARRSAARRVADSAIASRIDAANFGGGPRRRATVPREGSADAAAPPPRFFGRPRGFGVAGDLPPGAGSAARVFPPLASPLALSSSSSSSSSSLAPPPRGGPDPAPVPALICAYEAS